MKYAVWGLVVLLVVLHQDVWNWDNDRLVFGFLPMTLAFHGGISIAAQRGLVDGREFRLATGRPAVSQVR